NQLNAFASTNAGFQSLSGRLQSIQVEIQDIASELEHLKSQVTLDPARIEILNERLSLGYRLQKKHGVKSTRELLEIHEALGKKLQEVLDIDESIARKEKEAIQCWEDAGRLAMRISDARTKQVKPFEDKVNKLLTQVGMPNAKLKVEMGKTELQSDGCDTIDFLFDANLPAGKQADPTQFLPLRKVASGGELSRLMLCIKSLVAQSIDLPTMIFDEIDTGISGEAARQVAVLLKELASRRQVIGITHQPQIAGKADTHFFVYKEIVNDRVVTNIRKLNTEERITAIARMLSGERPTAAAMANAREMVMN
ncbi:MAG TPA: hypothetical protein VLJ68_09105, partial [Chitinophagaceae bacterium]|nr:hypothetical protein [Chitinophagaceae bacterium]